MVEIDPNNPPKQKTINAAQLRDLFCEQIKAMSEEDFRQKWFGLSRTIMSPYDMDVRSNSTTTFAVTEYHPKT
jgi:hypothetical protein